MVVAQSEAGERSSCIAGDSIDVQADIIATCDKLSALESLSGRTPAGSRHASTEAERMAEALRALLRSGMIESLKAPGIGQWAIYEDGEFALLERNGALFVDFERFSSLPNRARRFANALLQVLRWSPIVGAMVITAANAARDLAFVEFLTSSPGISVCLMCAVGPLLFDFARGLLRMVRITYSERDLEALSSVLVSATKCIEEKRKELEAADTRRMEAESAHAMLLAEMARCDALTEDLPA